MAISAGKLAPSAVVLAFVGYCVWPSLSEMISPPPPPTPPAKVPELAASLFSPTIPPVPTRNPWGGLDAKALAAAKESANQVDTTSEEVVDSAIAKTVSEPVDPLTMLKLGATSILGDQRMAVINGQLCAAEETLTVENAAYRVVRVLPYKVVLENKGKIVELTYANVASRSTATAPDGVQAKPVPENATLMEKPSANLESSLPKPPPALESLFEQSGVLGSLFKKQSGALESLLKKRSAAVTGTVADEINPSNKAGD
jgi:hypothetical protein